MNQELSQPRKTPAQAKPAPGGANATPDSAAGFTPSAGQQLADLAAALARTQRNN
jgi:hypothetical protein